MCIEEEDLDPEWEGWESGEQLYMMEVLVDRVKVREDQASAAADPVLPTLLKIVFADFPVMLVGTEDLLLAEKMESDNSSTLTIHDKPIKGMPEDWIVKKAGSAHYTVQVPVMSRPSMWNRPEDTHVKILVPRLVVAAGEGLEYIFAALRSRGEEEALNIAAAQVTQELKRVEETGESKVVTQHKFSTGKSCLFHMSPSELIRHLQEFPLKIQVYRNSTEGEEFVHTLIGEANIPLGLSFTKAVYLANTPVLLPVAAHMENVFPMMDAFGKETGSVCLFVRLSCFGASVFREEEDVEANKYRFLKMLKKNEERGEKRGGVVELNCPWKQKVGALKERPPPRPRLQPMYEPLPPAPPPPPPPFDMAAYLPGLPRCSPLSPPPCYRRPGHPPLSKCTRQMEAQLHREEHTKAAQTEPPIRPQVQVLAGGSPDTLLPPSKDACTCLAVPPELLPYSAGKQKLECTCAALMKTLGPIPSPAQQPSVPLPVESTKVPEAPVLGDSDYEINLTKAGCELEGEKADLPTPVTELSKYALTTSDVLSKGGISRTNKPTISNYESNEKIPESVENVLKEEAIHHKETLAEGLIQSENKNEEEKQSVSSPQRLEDNYTNELEFYEHEENNEKQKRHIKRRTYVQTPGMYPGRHVGHKHCRVNPRPVPKSMGWLWSSVKFYGLLKPGRGWRPGFIRRDVDSMMQNHRMDDSDDEPKSGKATKTQRYRPFSAKSQQSRRNSEKGKAATRLPTLHIHKKEGYIYVSMIPVKTDSQEEAGEEPKPILFKIDPKHPDGVEDGESCYGSSSSSSGVKSYEMDFIAPLALKKKKMKTEKNVVGTQYNEADFVKKTAKKQKHEPEPPPIKTPEKKKGKKKRKTKREKINI